ncbi:MAG: hypothetical protein FVQ83_13450 [Chloroflexi bacterium]|nr:hypothetical protein [Chloroflexota bacterium]
MSEKFVVFLNRWVTVIVWVYFTFLFGWLFAYVILGDRNGYLALVNTLAVYLFSPLPFVLLLGVFLRRREIWTGVVLGMLVFLWLWGGLFIPKRTISSLKEPSLKVMTYNVLGLHTEVQPVIDVIREVDADLVFLQEVNAALQAAIENELIDQYAYSILDPRNDVTGIGVLSKFPLQDTGERLPFEWVGVPQLLVIDWNGIDVYLVNFHMWALGLASAYELEWNFRLREMQARSIVDYVEALAGPAIIAGDANTTSLNTTYKILNSSLIDVWRQAGFGLGHTFPGSEIMGSSRPIIAGWAVPQWLARIDYIFISDHWQVSDAIMAPYDGVSDHRGVVTWLTLEE